MEQLRKLFTKSSLFILLTIFSHTSICQQTNSVLSSFDSLETKIIKMQIGSILDTGSFERVKPLIESICDEWEIKLGDLTNYSSTIKSNNNLKGCITHANLVKDYLRELAKKKNNWKTTVTRLTGAMQSFDKYEMAYVNDLSLGYTEQKINELRDTLISLTDYGPLFVGPCLYVENTYGFNVYVDSKHIPNLSFSFEALYYSAQGIGRPGGSLNAGWSFNEDKIVAMMGFLYLDDKIDSKLATEYGMTFNTSLLFRNREWMAGLSWSPITGGGVKLMIGI